MRKQLLPLISIPLLLALLTGCAAKSMDNLAMEESVAATEAYEETYEIYDTAESDAGGFDLPTEVVVQDRKLIYTADYSISTKQFEADYQKILDALEAANGYLSNESTDGTEPKEYGDPGRSASLTLRIPLEQYESFLEALSGIGTVESKSQYTEDVTRDYYDNESRLELYEAHYKKLMEYLDKASSIEDMMSIEAQITETLYTIDSLKGNKSYYDNMTQYTTVNIYLSERVNSSDVPLSKQTLGERISDSFGDVISALGAFFEGFLVVLIGGAPVWGILIVIFLAIFLPIRHHRKKKMKKSEE